MTIYVNESSTATVRAKFYDDANDPFTPNSVRYLIRDITNDRVVRDWTTLFPDSVINIEIPASDNELYEHTRRQKRFERRVLTVQANVGEASQRTNEIEYWLRNLAGIDNS